MKKEVELKIFLDSDDSPALALLSKLPIFRESTEEDTYYTSQHKDFILTEECLRIRERDGFSELTWKPPTNLEMKATQQYWKEELNLNLQGQAAIMRRILDSLDFVEYVKVKKHRTEYLFDNDTKIMLDKIEGIGLFVEIETFSEQELAAVEKNELVLKHLGLSQCKKVFRPYRDIVRDRRL